jgi:hypothetical protein
MMINRLNAADPAQQVGEVHFQLVKIMLRVGVKQLNALALSHHC